MSQAILLRIHRWISVVFSIPLLLVIATGLILSFQPLVQSQSIKPNSVSAVQVEALLQKFDPGGKARGLSFDPVSNRMRIIGGPGGEIDLATGEKASAPATLTSLFQWARGTHEKLIGDLEWLVVASTIAMLCVISIGILMGLPRLRNSLSGWHKGVAWFALPLVILSPLTGLLLAFNVTFAPSAAPGSGGKPVALREAVKMVAAGSDISRLSSLMTRGGRLMARIDEGGELRAYGVTAQGLTPLPRNWPRLIHEGNWSGVLASVVNIVTSFALLTLLCTGLLIWARRTFRKPKRVRNAAPSAAKSRVPEAVS